jgi:hypothetical protein
MLQILLAYLFIVGVTLGRDNGKKYEQPEFSNGAATYAAVAARGLIVAGTYNTQSLRATSAQTQHGVVDIRGPLTERRDCLRTRNYFRLSGLLVKE